MTVICRGCGATMEDPAPSPYCPKCLAYDKETERLAATRSSEEDAAVAQLGGAALKGEMLPSPSQDGVVSKGSTSIPGSEQLGKISGLNPLGGASSDTTIADVQRYLQELLDDLQADDERIRRYGLPAGTIDHSIGLRFTPRTELDKLETSLACRDSGCRWHTGSHMTYGQAMAHLLLHRAGLTTIKHPQLQKGDPSLRMPVHVERGQSAITGRIKFGDYMNDRFSQDASYHVDRVEHDPQEVSLILSPVDGSKDYFERHIHLNIPRALLLELAAAQLQAETDQSFYPGREPGRKR